MRRVFEKSRILKAILLLTLVVILVLNFSSNLNTSELILINNSPNLLTSSIGSNDLLGEKEAVFKDSANHQNKDGGRLRQTEDKTDFRVVRKSQDEVTYIFFIKI